MKRVLILGATGKLGKALTKSLLDKNYFVTTLVRNPEKLKFENSNLKIIKGIPYDPKDLEKSLNNIDVVISTLGHGFRTKFPIQERTFQNLIPLMEFKKIKKLITITGAGLILKDDPKSLIGVLSEKIFFLIDPYRMIDARNQQKLLEKSQINWTVIRTPIHNNKSSQNIRHIGFNQPMPWYTISRITISNFMIENIDSEKWNKKSPIIY